MDYAKISTGLYVLMTEQAHTDIVNNYPRLVILGDNFYWDKLQHSALQLESLITVGVWCLIGWLADQGVSQFC